MKKHIIIALIGIALFGFIGLGVHQVVTTRQRIQLKNIQIKDTSAKLKEIEIHYDTVNVKLDKMRQEKNVDQEQFNQVQRERDELKKQLDEKERQLQARLEAKRIAAEKAQEASRRILGVQTAHAASGDTKHGWLAAAGTSDTYHAALIVNKESGWQIAVTNSIGCIGLIQACPEGLKPRMIAECPNWASDPVCQLRIAESYMKKRYGTWANAWRFHLANNWW